MAFLSNINPFAKDRAMSNFAARNQTVVERARFYPNQQLAWYWEYDGIIAYAVAVGRKGNEWREQIDFAIDYNGKCLYFKRDMFVQCLSLHSKSKNVDKGIYVMSQIEVAVLDNLRGCSAWEKEKSKFFDFYRNYEKMRSEEDENGYDTKEFTALLEEIGKKMLDFQHDY